MQLLNGSGETYFGAAGLAIGSSADADWVQSSSYEILTLAAELDLGATPISGLLYLEYTPDPARLRCIQRVLLPSESLHAVASGVTLASGRAGIALTAAADGVTFMCSFSRVAAGSYRWRWQYGSGGSSPNRLFGFFEAKEE